MEHVFNQGPLPRLQSSVAMDVMPSMWAVVVAPRLVRAERGAALDRRITVAFVSRRHGEMAGSMLGRLHAVTWPVVVIVLVVTSSEGVSAQRRTPGGQRQETYVSATIDPSGRLVIARANGRSIVVPRERDQTAFSAPVVSSARSAVAAQAMFGNCCTSYDIPLQLVVYAQGKVHRFKGVGLPIFQWGFADSGTRIAYGQETVHFACATHYELRDIASERLIEAVDVPRPCGQDPDPGPVTVPRWVEELMSKEAA